jgi:RHS repeat-associated protein
MNGMRQDADATRAETVPTAPVLTLPKGGGAIRGIAEKFATNAVTGTASITVPIATSPGRAGFEPTLSLAYDSGSGNGVFGLGWALGVASIARKTEAGLPRYDDPMDSDTFVLTGAEDLVPAFKRSANGSIVRGADGAPVRDEEDRGTHVVRRYLPRVEGAFARIERWVRKSDDDAHWRVTSAQNVVTIYGQTAASRIADPADPRRVFRWLISSSYDDKGNAVTYEYARENSDGVLDDASGAALTAAHERSRSDLSRSANRYLKRIKYGNRDTNLGADGRPGDPVRLTDWMFEVVLDYGEGHYRQLPASDGKTLVLASAAVPPGGRWPMRADPFSTYRPGFEVRTYRLCQRVLMFHHFADQLGIADCLVASTEFIYAESANLTRLVGVVQSGYLRQAASGQDNRYERGALPPLEFAYSEVPTPAELATAPLHELEPEEAANLPFGVEGADCRWLDLDGEGSAGVLVEEGDAWYFMRNRSANHQVTEDGRPVTTARLGPLEPVATAPSAATALGALALDWDGDGVADLVRMSGPDRGVYSRRHDGAWEPLRSFDSWPTADVGEPGVRLVDLDGDGRVDILMADAEGLCWYASTESGFVRGRRVSIPSDDPDPRRVLADPSGCVYLADMSGDGLPDLVHIHNGDVSYLPNLGHGRWGRKVTMDASPWFDAPDAFDARRLRLADTDGSGTIDVLYLAPDGIQVHLNQAGNSWCAGGLLAQLPTDQPDSIEVVDLLGAGTACIVSTTRRNGSAALRYVDLMGGRKPHLLTHYDSGMGKTVRIDYRPSTYFYLADLEVGARWMTTLPFPVHCVERVTIEDGVRETVFTSSFTYHHGYYDGPEREFRGFARVDQLDTDSYSDFKLTAASNVVEEHLHQAPVLVKTWFHTGARSDERVLHQLRGEYYDNQAAAEHPLAEAELPVGLSPEELREAFRACRALPLRREVYAVDASSVSEHPYTTSESTFALHVVQPRDENRHASFLVTAAETIAYQYERNPGDPRISQALVLETDELGHVTKSASVSYGRRRIDPELPASVASAQRAHHVLYTETEYTNDVRGADVHRLRVPFDSRSYELTGAAPTSSGFFTAADLKAVAQAAQSIPFERVAGAGARRRLVARAQTELLRDDLSAPLGRGVQERLGLVYRLYQLAFTSGQISSAYGTHVPDGELVAAGYVHRNGDGDWWLPSGIAVYAANSAERFYLPASFRDALGTTSTVVRDADDLLTESVTDALGNQVRVENDYRVLGPWRATDVNGNRSAVERDALGVVVKTAVLGKANEADSLSDPTTRLEYDLLNWRTRRRPNYVLSFARERHGAANPRWQERVVYMDGDGSEVMVKAQAPPGIALRFNETTGKVDEVDTSPAVRWIATGRTVLNNKGSPVKRYEPYFAATSDFENARELVGTGVTAHVFYDPLGRTTRVEYPDGTLARTEFGPWHQRRYDSNDTVLESRWYGDRGKPDPDGPEPSNREERAAWLAAKHANTPAVAHVDSLERAIYSIADNGTAGRRVARSEMDLTGARVRIFDARDRLVATSESNMLGAQIHGDSPERGQRWVFADVLGATRRVWDGSGRDFRSTYDVLHRPLSVLLRQGTGAETVVTHMVYGERHPQAVGLNLRGRLHRSYDQAGLATVNAFDVDGNAVSVGRRFASVYRTTVDWRGIETLADLAAIDAAVGSRLESETFTGTSSFDALGRPIEVVLPDKTVTRPHFNEGNILASLEARVGGVGNFVTFLADQEYDAKGQRRFARYGNGLVTRYVHDPETLRLTDVVTKRESDPDAAALQRLSYTYDPVGNVTQIADGAQQTLFFRNAVVTADRTFEYDALYELVRATGRERAVGNPPDHRDVAADRLPHPNDATAVRRYTERYGYDALGNLRQLEHVAGSAGWTRRYRYAYDADPANRTNRLIATSAPGDPENGPFSQSYAYDGEGHMIAMPHLASMNWDFRDLLQNVDLGGGGTAYYVYGSGGQRLRKVIERVGGLRVERLYLGPVEIYRERVGSSTRLERRTLHIADNTGRIAQVDTKTIDAGSNDPSPLGAAIVRYRYTDHLDSSVVETDAAGNSLALEEFHPFGTSAYRSGRADADTGLKRYRYLGRERDGETSLYCLGARYYAAWLGRWTSADPAGFVDGSNLYAYARNNPVALSDTTGTQSTYVNVKPGRFTGRESFEQLGKLAAGIPGWQLDPTLTPENYKSRWIPGPGPGGSGGGWDVMVPTGAQPPPGDKDVAGNGDGGTTATGGGEEATPPKEKPVGTGAAETAAGLETVRSNPEGFTLEVPNNFDEEKLAAYKERITSDRGVGHRSVGADGSRTNDIRRANQGLRDAFEASLPNGRPPGDAVDHTVELQHIIRSNDTVRPQDHRLQPSGLNSSQGSSARHTADRQIAAGAPEDVPAGGVSRTSQMGRFVNRPGFRTALRGAGYALMVAGPALTAYGASQIENAAVRYGGYGLAGVEAVGTGAYMYGRIVMGGGEAGNLAGRAVMGVGGRLAMGAGGAAQALIGGYMFVQDLQRGDYVAAGFDGLSALGGVALVAAAIIGAGPLAVGLAVAGIVTGVLAGGYHFGKWMEWW